jgi:signal transduction histidine kinase
MRVHSRLADLVARPHLPRRTVRLRLTLVYGALFLVTGAALLAVTYALVVHATDGVIFKGQNLTVVAGSHKGSAQGTAPPAQTQTNGTSPKGVPQLSPQLAEQLANRQHAAELHQLLLQSGIALAVMTLVSIGLGWLVAGRVLRPLRTITTAVHDISETNLHRRLALAGPDDELKELGDTFDALLARLDGSFQAQRRFVANASHELRTPLARQRTLGQVALADPDATVESLRAAHERVLAAGGQQQRLIDAMLTLARGQAGTDRHEHFDIAGLTMQILATRSPEATARDIDLRTNLRHAPVAGDPRLVERLIANLVDNALRHNRPGGHVDVRTQTRAGQAVLSVSNTGPVVPHDAVDELFQPFRRVDADRTSHGDGLGLGLSIVQAIADAHHATITALPRPRGGLSVEVRFPNPARHNGSHVTASPHEMEPGPELPRTREATTGDRLTPMAP